MSVYIFNRTTWQLLMIARCDSDKVFLLYSVSVPLV